MKGLLHEPGGGVMGTGIPMASIVNKLGEGVTVYLMAKINASNV